MTKFGDQQYRTTDDIADLQKMAVAEWLQSFNSVRGPVERLVSILLLPRLK